MLDDFIKACTPHEFKNGAPPNNKIKRHEWESKLLYSVKSSLSNDCALLDYGCGKYATMRFSLWNRFPKSKYIGIDPVMRHRRNTNNMRSQIKKPKKPSIVIEDKYKLHNLSYLSTAIEEATCVVAGSVFTHLAWESIKDFLYQLDPFFGRGGEIGFTIFLGDEYIENFTGGKNFYKRKDAYHAVVTTIEQYTDYCEEQGLQFTLLPYTYELLHDLIKNPEGDIAIASQHFCNIRRNI